MRNLYDTSQVQQLIVDGADVSVQKDDDATPLHACATLGHTEVCMALLEAGAFVEAVGKHGATPLMTAARYIQQCGFDI